MLVTAKHVHVRLLLLGVLTLLSGQTIAWMAHLCSGRIQENLAPLWALVPDVGVEDHPQGEKGTSKRRVCCIRTGSLCQEAWVSPTGDNMWASLVVIIERGGIAGPHGKGVMACGCSGTQWLITDANEMLNGEGIQARGAGWQKRLPFIHSFIHWYSLYSYHVPDSGRCWQ